MQSQSITKIASALLNAQKKIESASKDATNPYFKSKYADLNAVMDACKTALNENGIVVLQPIQSDEVGDYVETTLLHESGEYLSSKMRITVAKQNDPQAQGSAITYARRYSLQSMVFIGAEDDDGEGAMKRVEQPKQAVKNPQPKALEHYCDYHKCKMFLNKNGNPYHKDEKRGFCNGRGYQDEIEAHKANVYKKQPVADSQTYPVEDISDQIPF